MAIDQAKLDRFVAILNNLPTNDSTLDTIQRYINSGRHHTAQDTITNSEVLAYFDGRHDGINASMFRDFMRAVRPGISNPEISTAFETLSGTSPRGSVIDSQAELESLVTYVVDGTLVAPGETPAATTTPRERS